MSKHTLLLDDGLGTGDLLMSSSDGVGSPTLDPYGAGSVDLMWGSDGVGPPTLDLYGTGQVTGGLNLAARSPLDFANFSVVDTHTIDAEVWGGGTVNGNLTETVSAASIFDTSNKSHLTASVAEQITTHMIITDSANDVVQVTMVDIIHLTLTGRGYTGGTATSIAAATTEANGVSQPNGQTIQVGSGSAPITAAAVTITGGPSWALLNQHQYGNEMLTISGNETLSISASLTSGATGITTTATESQDLQIHINLSPLGVVGVASDPSGQFPLTISV